MIANIIKWSIGNRVLVLLLAGILTVWGLVAIKNIPLDAIPDLSEVQVIIKTSYPGQAPQVVEDQITYPLTTAMLSVPKAVNVRGYSFFGDSYVYVIFEDGTDLYWARSRVLEYLSQATSYLPSQAKPRLGPDATGVGWVYEYALRDKTGQHDLSQLRSLQDWFLKFELQTVPGVSEVATIGGMVKQYQVVVNPNSLRAHNIPLSVIKNAIQQGNQETGGSVIEMAEAEYMVRSTGYINDMDDLKNIPLMLTDNGTPILLSDVADIRLGPQMRRGIAELDGEGEVVGGVIIMRSGENALKTIEAVKAKLEVLKASLPDGVEIVTTYDRSSLINRAVTTLSEKLIEEFIVVALICALFLFHFRSSLVIILSLPVGILIAFIVMQRMGINANIMSLGGIAIAIGAMVDASIVMIENLHKHMEKTEVTDENRWSIIAKASCEVGPALFFSLMIITLSFLPIFTLQSQEGRLFTPLAYTKTFAMAAAAFLSITLVPVLMGYFVRGKIVSEHNNPINRWLIKLYQPIMNRVIKSPKKTIGISAFIVVIGFFPITQLGSEFMPDLDEGDLLYMPSTFPSVSIGKAQELIQQTDKIIMTVPEVKRVFGKIGRADSATDPAPLTMVETTIQFKPKSEWREGMTMLKIRDELDARLKIPGVSNIWVMPIKNRIDMLATGIKTPVGIKVAGADLNTIEAIGRQIENTLNKMPDTASVYSERVASGRYVTIDIDRLAAARFGLNIRDIQDVVSTAIGGMQVGTTVEGLERYPINIRYPRDVRDSLQKIKELPIVTPMGAHIPLSEVAAINIESGPGMIKTENSRLNGWIYVDIKSSDIGSYVDEAKMRIADEIQLPAGYSINWSGQYEYMQRVVEKLTTVLPATIAVIIILLFLNFRNFTEVAIILGTLPMSLIGGIWLLYLLDYNLSVAVAVGFIALAGVAIEIGVVMLVYLNQALQEQLEEVRNEQREVTIKDIKSAVVAGSLKRIRPIVMTVTAVIAGLLPIMFGGGTGSEVMRRIAAPMVGGMTSTLIFSLLILPAVFLIWKQKTLCK
ncbi:MAG TPA: efflux RND transporter permease subunit [Cycloclasticus sp.]|jgi:Cu(I)/Ag(I) efflux system membrane protein CusA/SilA|nr:efflux RND transporter permease subunit [Cycloclasticus sp.]